MIPLTLLFFAQKRNLLIPLELSGVMHQGSMEPAPERGERTPWRTFLAAHWETVAATDFFTIEVATVRRLVTYYVLVVISESLSTWTTQGRTDPRWTFFGG